MRGPLRPDHLGGACSGGGGGGWTWPSAGPAWGRRDRALGWGWGPDVSGSSRGQAHEDSRGVAGDTEPFPLQRHAVEGTPNSVRVTAHGHRGDVLLKPSYRLLPVWPSVLAAAGPVRQQRPPCTHTALLVPGLPLQPMEEETAFRPGIGWPDVPDPPGRGWPVICAHVARSSSRRDSRTWGAELLAAAAMVLGGPQMPHLSPPRPSRAHVFSVATPAK